MRTCFVFLFVLLVLGALAQDYPRKEIDASTWVDEIFAMQDLNINYQDLYENYLQILSNPLDLNTVNAEQLQSLYVLSVAQIQAFMQYRHEAGPFLSVYELQNIEGLNKDVFTRLIPFVTVIDEPTQLSGRMLQRIVSEKNNYLLLRGGQTLEEQRGYRSDTDSASRYAGSPANVYVRFRVSKPGDFSFGFTFEKDAGEALQWNPAKKQYGFDYVSFHAQIQNKGRIKNLVLGDFQVQFGQGIALGSVFGIGKNGEAVTTIRRSNLGASPYTSLYEAGYFRGMAVTYALTRNIYFHALGSSRARDGTAVADSLNEQSNVVSSFSYTGLHRTPRELANRATVQEANVAGVLNYKTSSIDAGILFHRTEFSSALNRAAAPYNQFYFNGNQNQNVGAFLNYTFRNVSFFSEWTHTIGNGNAFVAGMLTSLTPKLDLSLLYRNFDRNFYSFYSNALAENSVPQNENGFYWGWKYTFNKKVSFAGYADLFASPWLKYRSYSPATGSEWLLRVNYRPSKSVYLFAQVREENKQRNVGEDISLHRTAMATRRNYWLNIDYAATFTLSFKTRFQFSTFDFNGHVSQGSAVIQDVSLTRGKTSITGRYALFDTDNFDNRLYVYERDVWLAFSFPAYNGKGTRAFLLFQYEINKHLTIWLRWASTIFLNRDTIGSGGDTIIGNTENDVKFQVRLRL